MKQIKEVSGLDYARFESEIRAEASPIVVRGLAQDWPAVQAGKKGGAEFIEYIKPFLKEIPRNYAIAPNDINGCFHYDNQLNGLNFKWEVSTVSQFLDALSKEANEAIPRAFAMQGIEIRNFLPQFEERNNQSLRPNNRGALMWIANQSKVATHHDPFENLAIVVCGQRRFTIFPPNQIGNLYIGPLHYTPAGTPVSMVHLTAPDFDKYPKFAEALKHAQYVDLEPGDAVYLPYHWYHHVESKEKINVLVNYWWEDARRDIGSPWDALLHNLLVFGNLPEEQRKTWREVINHFAFHENGDPWAHIPPHARGPLVNAKPENVGRILDLIIDNLSK